MKICFNDGTGRYGRFWTPVTAVEGGTILASVDNDGGIPELGGDRLIEFGKRHVYCVMMPEEMAAFGKVRH